MTYMTYQRHLQDLPQDSPLHEAGFLLAEPAYFGTDVPDLRLTLHRITNNPRRTVEILL